MRTAVRLPAFSVGKTTVAPVIDGRADDPVWRNAPRVPLMLTRNTTPKSGDRTPRYGTDLRLLSDGRTLFLLAIAENPEAGTGKPPREVWGADTIEFFFDNSVGMLSGNWQTLIMNRFGQVYMSHRGGDIPLAKLDPKTFQSAVREEKGKRWILESAIPLASLGITEQNRYFIGQVGRAIPGKREVSAAGDLTGSFHENYRFVRFSFASSNV
ncbi:MAG: sugar-binding protein, partial [Victivallaceae bacterium]|nr:sugar-binding protein [Victivallaceae bacterium]